jgi:ABC-type transport system substrate-binding protein
MKIRVKRELLALTFLILLLHSFFVSQPSNVGQAQVQPTKGPRVDDLLVKIYSSPSEALAAFNACETDIPDTDMDPSLLWNDTIIFKPYEKTDIYDLEINNNKTIQTYRNWTSPTWDPNFRHALAHLADKNRYVTEVLNGWGLVLDTPVMPWLREWFNPNADKHPFNRTEAAAILDAAGYTWPPIEWRVYPLWHEKAGQMLDPVIFVTRVDDPIRLTVAQMFRDELVAIGIPVNFLALTRAQVFEKVMVERDYHIYTGAIDIDKDPVYMYDFYHTNQLSKDLISDPELDYWLEILKWAPDRATAKTAAWEAQRRLAEIVGTIPLLASKALKAHKKGWAGTVNQKDLGIDSFWTFINAWPYNYTDPEHPDLPRPWTIRHGFSSDIGALNPVCSSCYQDWLVLDKVYDTMIKENPFDPTIDLPWMATSWNVSAWIDPQGLDEKTKLTFYLSDKIYWHTTMPPPIPLTSEDVKFTIEYLLNYTDAWNYWRVANVHHVETPDPYTVVIYENILSYWTLHWIGELPIIPKYIWENIPDPHGFMPDPTLTGSGPFIFSEYMPSNYILLRANRNYFMPWHLRGDVNFDKIVDIFDLVMVALAFGSTPGDPNYNQHVDICARYDIIDIFDLVLVALEFGQEWLPDP